MRTLGIKYYYHNRQHILNIYKYVKQKMKDRYYIINSIDIIKDV